VQRNTRRSCPPPRRRELWRRRRRLRPRDGYDPGAPARAEAIRRDGEGDLSGAVDTFGSVVVKFDPKNAGACVSAADSEPVPVPTVLSELTALCPRK
jgi:hypothetical protein